MHNKLQRLGVIAAAAAAVVLLVLSLQTFRASVEVQVSPPSIPGPSHASPAPQSMEMTVSCSRNGGTFVADDGATLFFNEASFVPQDDAASLCGDLRADRNLAFYVSAAGLLALAVFLLVKSRKTNMHERSRASEARMAASS